MKKYEKFSEDELRKICEESESYREIAIKIGYFPDSGSAIRTVKEMIEEHNFDTSHLKGQGHSKNLGKHHIPLEDYLNNKRKITSYKLRNRLFEEGIFPKKCMKCGNTKWLGEEIPLELHHKDGNKENNSIENLEILCPNCHYFTETYKTKNWKL